MPGRILNFSEFFDKYSKDSGSDDKNLDNLTQASANFEEGFDKETYDQTQLGPNKPVAGGSDTTPAMPGETGSPAFSSKSEDDMSAPTDETEAAESTEMEEPTEESAEEPTPETKSEDETPEPEAGANPEEEKKSETNESVSFGKIKNFAQFIAESDWGADYLQDDDYWSGEDQEEECATCGDSQYSSERQEEACPECGTSYDEYGAMCGCNM